MKDEEHCVNEKRGLLQECLPGVTLPNNHAYYHQRQPSELSTRQPQEIDQLQQQILISKVMNEKSIEDCNGYSTPALSNNFSKRKPNNSSTDESLIHVLWIDKDSNIDGYSDNDDLDDIASYSFSIRRAAAVSEAKRRSEERWVLYFKYFLSAAFFLMLWGEFQPKDPNTSSYKTRFRLSRHWNKKAHSVYVGLHGSRDDNERRRILVALKDLDEGLQSGDIVLRSNKTKFLNAAMVWQRQDCIVDEPLSLASSPQHILPPLAVVEAKSVDDVQLAVPILGGLARDYQLEFRVRSGGYAYMSGFSTVSDGVMLSLADLNDITINDRPSVDDMNTTNIFEGSNKIGATSVVNSTSVVIGPGVRTDDFMKEVLDVNGYSSIVASAAGVGMGGFILGGGYGLQSRMYGLAIDNVIRLDVVLPTGEKRSVKDGDDLFWALRGSGGGNIGVVTSIEYLVYPSHDIKLEASVKVSLSDMTQFLQRVGEKESDLAPEFTLGVQGYVPRNHTIDDVSHNLILNNYSEEEKDGLVTIYMYWMGDSNPEYPVGMQYIKEEITPLFPKNSTGENIAYYYFSWSGMSREREQKPESKSVWSAQSWNGFLLPSNNTQEVWTDIESSLSAMFMYCKFVSPKVELWGGAISDIRSNATAFPHRNAIYNVGVELIVPTESDMDAASDEIHLVNAIWPSIARHLGGVYINYPMASLSNESYPTAYWGENLDRLVTLSEKYDPTRVLKVAQGVPVGRNVTSFPSN